MFLRDWNVVEKTFTYTNITNAEQNMLSILRAQERWMVFTIRVVHTWDGAKNEVHTKYELTKSWSKGKVLRVQDNRVRVILKTKITDKREKHWFIPDIVSSG